ncbi:sensor domain-containing diguanylate cyclase [Butyrivibrio sp. AE3006]|uniref:sensor domain-containing diguanylate cyclase n=1 Tax=Butyrivibrio sp. AE3006 TaxID=1280673 RepID=UPI000408EAE4|nr:diguanylate cyclase [Butyrivibrio sp. AE3006]
MKLLQTSLNDIFETTIQSWVDHINSNNRIALFHVYVPYDYKNKFEKLEYVRSVLKEKAPAIPVIGCSATGEILNGKINDKDIVVTAMVFDDPGTGIEVRTTYDHTEELDADAVFNEVKSIPHIKGIEILTVATNDEFENAAEIVDNLPESIVIYGGVAVGDDNHKPFVFAGDGTISYTGSAYVIYKGKDLHIQANRMFGWKPIGYPLEVTKAEGCVVYELDGKPAYEVYNHYLHIKKDQNFFYDALEFPWEVSVGKDTAYIRHAKSVNPDGSIVMSSNIPQGSCVRLTFGDPRRIIKHTKQTIQMILEFAPQVVNMVNCMGRKLFWAENEDIEVSLISKHMESTGFSALGEILRYKGMSLINNLSIVTVAMREGPPGIVPNFDFHEAELSTNLPVTARLAIFINTITEEIMEKNEQLNEMLYKASHDALTGLLNRGAIERLIYENNESVSGEDLNWHLIMFDVDDFKKINDRYGHSKGDAILKYIADTLSDYISDIPNAEAGRWGGEEFMVFISGHEVSKVKEIADTIHSRVRENSKNDMLVTISVGATSHHSDEAIQDTLDRVDKFLYEAKESGKDRVCTDL